jgi:hypothetical protein
VGTLCNPTPTNRGCNGTNVDAPPEDRTGADPINPIFDPNSQSESPVNHGKFSSHYLLLMVGATTFF